MAGPRPSVNGPVRTKAQKRRTSARRFELLNAFWDLGTARALSRTDALVWLALYRHARPDRTISISFRQVAEMLGADRVTVVRSIRRLRDSKLLKRVRLGGPNRGSNVYKLLPCDLTRVPHP
jgi:DNA-binding MarR family transcriptional regulator